MRTRIVSALMFDPEIHLGPVTLAWHGLTIAVGIFVGAWAATRWAREEGISADPLHGLTALLAVAGIVGGRLFYVVEQGGPLFAKNGFTFDGGVIAAALTLALYAWRTGITMRYLDAIGAGLALGVAIGRIGDVINGEHYGKASDSFLGRP